MTQRKVNMAMVKTTPIRLVALDEEPPEDDVTQIQDVIPVEETTPTPVAKAKPAEDAAPLRSSPENEAITRRVPAVSASPTPAATPVVAPGPALSKAPRSWRKFVPVIVALVPVIGLSTAWILSRPGKSPEVAAPSPAPTAPAPAPAPVAVPHPPASPAASAGTKTPDVIRLQITVDPVQAEVGLDGNVLAGHRLNLEVPKDRGIHVVSASAPGYLPFNQQVVFSNDVVLTITLRRSHAPAARPTGRQRTEVKTQAINKAAPAAPPPVESKPQTAKTRPAPGRTEPGMDLDTPAPRHGAKSLDERNPYRP
jgi:hypothetical protein